MTRPLALAFGAVAAGLALGAAALPGPLRGGGLWEVSTKASGAGSSRHCLADSALLTQWEHRRAPCSRQVLAASPERATVQYRCAGGDFGTSRAELVTPRSVRVTTQGIAAGLPFGYTIYARRIGSCAPR